MHFQRRCVDRRCPSRAYALEGASRAANAQSRRAGKDGPPGVPGVPTLLSRQWRQRLRHHHRPEVSTAEARKFVTISGMRRYVMTSEIMAAPASTTSTLQAGFAAHAIAGASGPAASAPDAGSNRLVPGGLSSTAETHGASSAGSALATLKSSPSSKSSNFASLFFEYASSIRTRSPGFAPASALETISANRSKSPIRP